MYIPGFQVEVLKQLTEQVKNLQDHERWVILLFDEMKIREDLVYDKVSDMMIGFCNLQGVEKEIKELAK